MLAEALGAGEGGSEGGPKGASKGGPKNAARVEKFLRDGWARPWPVGVEMVCYMLSHEAHHRGQVCMLAHQLGFPLSNEAVHGIWKWEKLWGDCRSGDGPGYDS